MENKYKYYSDLCNYGAKTNSDWLKHTKSQKHARGGLKIKICPHLSCEQLKCENFDIIQSVQLVIMNVLIIGI